MIRVGNSLLDGLLREVSSRSVDQVVSPCVLELMSLTERRIAQPYPISSNYHLRCLYQVIEQGK